MEDESAIINRLFEAGIHRYHIDKRNATEQSIAEILEGIAPKFLSRITLHSHFHLVLAYGVGGIHYSLDHRNVIGADYPAKVQLYQGFGVKVSTDYNNGDWAPADYALSSDVVDNTSAHEHVFVLTNNLQNFDSAASAIHLEKWLEDSSIQEIVNSIKEE